MFRFHASLFARQDAKLSKVVSEQSGSAWGTAVEHHQHQSRQRKYQRGSKQCRKCFWAYTPVRKACMTKLLTVHGK